MNRNYTLYTDGSALSNPVGNAEAQLKIDKGDGSEMIAIINKLGFHSNNYAELRGLEMAIRWLCEHINDFDSATVYSDSRVALGWLLKNPSNKVLERPILIETINYINDRTHWLKSVGKNVTMKHWNTRELGEICADFGRK